MAHIDWLTLVGRRTIQDDDYSVFAAYRTAVEDMVDRQSTFIEAFGNPMDWQIVKPRAPYSFARRSDDCTRTLYVHPLAAHYTLEVSGTYCQRIGQMDWIRTLEAWQGSISRIDIAHDMECDVRPIDFARALAPTAIKTRSEFTSSTGETVYLGSRSSERYLRVYRYNPPHPRAKLLRAEFQLKGQYANLAAEAIYDGVTLNGLAKELGRVFGLNHPQWMLEGECKPLKVGSHAQSGHSVQWLTTVIAPMLRRMQREGKLDVQAWFDEYVMKSE
jgi:hypothetical protein